MGCGTSGQSSVARPDCPECLNREKTNGISINWERLKAVAQLAKTNSREVRNVMNANNVDQTKVSISDQSGKVRSGEEGLFELPTEEFMHGMLGLTIDDDRIRVILDTIAEGDLFVDFEFPTQSALYYSDRSQDDIVWMRPKDLVDCPVLFLDGTSRHDIAQGILGDCWLLSSCAAVAGRSDLMERVIPSNQPLFGEGYDGIVQFRFWRFGSWVKVYIDDQLPTKDGRLIYASCTDPTEFWVSLLEKAYAKLHGSYEAIEGGQTMDALVDLTGGLAERYDLISDEKRSDGESSLYKHLLQSCASGSFVTCSRKGDWRKAVRADNKGLVAGHAYTITDVKQITTSSSDTIDLLRIRNPWGNETEWNGHWSDMSHDWSRVNEREKEIMDFKNQSDGEFWMNFNDFATEFEEVSICTLGPDFDSDGTVDRVGQVKAIKGEWVMHKTSGGSRNDFLRFATNPQFVITLATENLNLGEKSSSSVVICLMQEHRRSDRSKGVHMHQIGFVLYKCPNDDCNRRLPAEYFMYNYAEGSTGTFINYREVFGRFELAAGNYIVVPATFEPDSPSRFIIRVYASDAFTLREVFD
uniref:Calpain catalytic domain-containing protein n=1 Tax=Strigamia maritima TaxID=126957 RepID=T1IQ80_STRMM